MNPRFSPKLAFFTLTLIFVLFQNCNLSGFTERSASLCSSSQILVDGSCQPSTVIVIPASSDDRNNLQPGINRAFSSQTPTSLILDPGVYRLKCDNTPGSYCLNVGGVNGLKIQGVPGKTKILITSPISGFLFMDQSKNITVHGISIDYETPPFSQVHVLNVSSDQNDRNLINTITVQIQDGFMEPNDALMFGSCLSLESCKLPPGQVFDSTGKWTKAIALADYFSTKSMVNLGGRKWKMTSYNDIRNFVTAGDQIAFAPLVTHGVVAQSSTNLNFYQVELRAAPFMGFVFVNVSGLIDVDSISIVPSPGRVLSINSDAYHLIDSRAKFHLHNGNVSNIGDDYINISSSCSGLSLVDDDKFLVGKVISQTYEIGDSIQITSADRKALRFPGDGTMTVKAVSDQGSSWLLTLDRSVKGIVQNGDMVFNVSTSSPGSSIRRNVVGSMRGSMRLRGQGMSVLENTFKDPKVAKILFSIESYWPEGPMTGPPFTFGNIVKNGTLRLYGLNWDPFTFSLPTEVFNASWYLQNYPDLFSAFGNNTYEATEHWRLNGMREGRQGSNTFLVSEYLKIYPDNSEGLGSTNYIDAIDHFVKEGANEGRVGLASLRSEVFNVIWYVDHYPDLRKAYGLNYAGAVDHWLTSGINEGRQGSPFFSSVTYLQRYNELERGFGAKNYKAAIMHYITSGISEGRNGRL